MRRPTRASLLTLKIAAILSMVMLGGCVTAPVAVSPFYYEEPYALLSVDESMSCEALTASFMFSARRAARLVYWLEAGPVAGFGHARFGIDGPNKLRDEFRRMDALSDQQRYKGCRVLEPSAVVAEERMRLDPIPLKTGPVLRSRG